MSSSTSEHIIACDQDADMTLEAAIEASKDDDEALALLSNTEHPTGASDCPTRSTATSSRAPPGPKAKVNNVSAVYRWYEVEGNFSHKKREESSIAKCKLCRQQGKLERKTCVRFSKSVTSNLWRHLKENHPDVYEKHAGEKKSVQMHRVVGVKKQGRKKKVQTPDATTGAEVSTQLQPPTETRPPRKKTKKGEQFTNVLMDYSVPTGKFNPEKVRGAMGYLCLYEMLPFELCSSPAFRSLLMECSGGVGGYVNESNSLTMIAKEVAFGYAKKMAAEVKVRTVMQMKMTDFSHLMISEWRSSSYAGGNGSSVTASALSAGCSTPGNEMVFLALFAVGLDQEFNPFRRCLHVVSIGNCRAEYMNSVAAMLVGDKELKKAMERVVPCRYMPEILAVESPCNAYQSFCMDQKLHALESVPMVLQNIMLFTINGVHVSGSYCLGKRVLPEADTGSMRFRNWRLDKGEYIESSTGAVTTDSSTDAVYGSSVVEIASSILEELPTSLTGHTYLDLINKILYLLAHFKQSPRSRMVLRRLAIEQGTISSDSYERLFIDRLREAAISVSGIHSALSLANDMMSTLKQYFLVHKDSASDFSKLVQLASLSRYEWSRVRFLTVILKPFAEATAKLDGEQYVASSLIVPSVFTLIEKLRESHPVNIRFSNESSSRKSDVEAMEDLPEDIEALRDLAFENLSACFGYLFSAPESSWSMEKCQTFNLLWSATILDPRTRSFIIKGTLPQHDFWEIIKTEAANIAGTKLMDEEDGNDFGESSTTLDEDNDHLDGNGEEKTTDLWDDLQANLASCAQEEMLLSSTKSSLEITKSSNLLEVEVSFFQEEGRIALRANPLEWWQSMRMKYPFLARLARYVLSIPCNVKVDDNPVLCGGDLVKCGPSQMTMVELCDLLAASMNLRTEKNSQFAAASKQMWSTV
ncbi:hypothetical protein PHMEG_0005929 [Phytophthora megakarya]|uniref:HAT C-terminal dimerisation domain-containing protein n=1 Tax=Phytophthora megakarya TaxID=4795 RepID=A0A225WQ49_9STRA|nr:hypothetical protein PHMEG_0005929 [Phytophthora megakarya]